MKKTLNIKGQLLDLSRPKVMGIINATPDSFYDRSRVYNPKKRIEKQLSEMVNGMVAAGVDIIDVGGYSTRPGAEDVPAAEEIRRVNETLTFIKKLHPQVILSVDTFRSEVAKAAVDSGADLVNDISGGTLDAAMPQTIADLKVPYILMHTRGTPQTMQSQSTYRSLVPDVIHELQQRVALFEEKGVRDIIVDPGFGFAKTAEQNFALLGHLEQFRILKKPLLAGISRKSMIWRTLGIEPSEALNGTAALHMLALEKGASVLRVHDVREAKEVVKLYENIQAAIAALG